VGQLESYAVRPVVATCPIHQSPVSVEFRLTKDGYDLYLCGECNHLFVHPAPTDEALRALYTFAQGYHCPDSQAPKEKMIGGVPKRFVDALRAIENARGPGSILDVGCSTGRFLEAARVRGWAALGVEMNAESAELARRGGHEVITGTIDSLDPRKRQFDAVHIAEVIEHVREPKEMLASAQRLLKPGGVLYLTTPNSDAFFARSTWMLYRLFRIPWSHATPPHHLHQFSTASLARLLTDCGFNPLSFTYVAPNLRYEIGQTGVIPTFRTALRDGISAHLLASAVKFAMTVSMYPALYAANWIKSARSQDCCLQCLARAS
jgi:SAM-dependent methyltransferase